MIGQEYIFVYGTLLPEFKNQMSRILVEQADFIAKGSVQGRLYEVDGYPGAILSDRADERVFGSVFEITAAKDLLNVLDAYEECREGDPTPHLYRREKALISCAGREEIVAWTYIYNLSVENLLFIPSGDYLLFRKL